jgi:hypothetical protein
LSSPLNPEALLASDIHTGMRVTSLKYLEDGSIDPSIEWRSFFTLEVISLTETSFTGEPIVGGNQSETIDFVDYGLAPDAEGNWSTTYCVVTDTVAKRLAHDWRAAHATPIARGHSSSNQYIGMSDYTAPQPLRPKSPHKAHA